MYSVVSLTWHGKTVSPAEGWEVLMLVRWTEWWEVQETGEEGCLSTCHHWNPSCESTFLCVCLPWCWRSRFVICCGWCGWCGSLERRQYAWLLKPHTFLYYAIFFCFVLQALKTSCKTAWNIYALSKLKEKFLKKKKKSHSFSAVTVALSVVAKTLCRRFPFSS